MKPVKTHHIGKNEHTRGTDVHDDNNCGEKAGRVETRRDRGVRRDVISSDAALVDRT